MVPALRTTSSLLDGTQGFRHFPALPRRCECSFVFALTNRNHRCLTPGLFPTFLCISAEPADHSPIQTPLLPGQAAARPYVGLSDAGTTPGEYHYSYSCFPSVLCLLEQFNISLICSPWVYAISKTDIPPGLDEMVTAPSKLSELILRAPHRMLSTRSCSSSWPFLFLSLTFRTLVFLGLCMYLLVIVLFHNLFFLMTVLNNRTEASQREPSSHPQQRMTAWWQVQC